MHLIRIGFEINAADEPAALDQARRELRDQFRAMEERHGEGSLPEGIDLHPDRIVLDRLAVRRVVTTPAPGSGPAA